MVPTETSLNTEPLAFNPPQAASVVSQPARTESKFVSWTAYAMAVWLAGVVALAAGLHIRLRREDFQSSEAKHTTILYCKSLLDAEDGKGTNVLFGDGHVEYLTAEELDRLKAAGTTSQD